MVILRTSSLFLALRCSPPPSLRSSPFSLNPNPLFHRLSSSFRCHRAMSGQRTVADVLMGAARAAAKKNTKKPSTATTTTSSAPVPSDPQPEDAAPPPKKPKTLDGTAHSDPEPKNSILELKKKGHDFNPKAAASWKDGEPVPFLFLARALDLISNESGRIAITDIICNVFRTVIATTPGDLLPTVYLSANKIAPPHEGIELGIGDASIVRALAEAYGRKEEHVKKQLKVLL